MDCDDHNMNISTEIKVESDAIKRISNCIPGSSVCQADSMDEMKIEIDSINQCSDDSMVMGIKTEVKEESDPELEECKGIQLYNEHELHAEMVLKDEPVFDIRTSADSECQTEVPLDAVPTPHRKVTASCLADIGEDFHALESLKSSADVSHIAATCSALAKEQTLHLRKQFNTDLRSYDGFKLCENSPHETQKTTMKCSADTQDTSKFFNCLSCEKSFKKASLLKRHEMTHLDTKPHACNLCERSFADKSNLKKHIVTHSGTKPYECSLCMKRFTQKSNLKTHIFTHSDTTPYACSLCEKRFKQKSHLKTHIVTHSTTKPHKCDLCERSFPHLPNLKHHMLTHSAKKPFQCDDCGMWFNHKSSLRRHIKTHEDSKPYKCNMCQKDFKISLDLNIHQHLHKMQNLVTAISRT